MSQWTPKDWRDMIITGTICLVILLTCVVWGLRGPESVPAEARTAMFTLVTFLAGGVVKDKFSGEMKP